MNIRRNVVGFDVITTETIKKERKTKNIIIQTIVRTTSKAIKLDCGHLISVTRFNKVPTKNTRCTQCEELHTQENGE